MMIILELQTLWVIATQQLKFKLVNFPNSVYEDNLSQTPAPLACCSHFSNGESGEIPASMLDFTYGQERWKSLILVPV